MRRFHATAWALAALLVGGVAATAAAQAPAGAPEDHHAREADAPESFDRGRRAVRFGARGGAWLAYLRARVEVPDGQFNGGRVSFTSDLDLEEWDPAPYVEVFLQTRFVSVAVDYWQTERKGRTTIDGEVQFGPFVFEDSVPVEAEFDVRTVGGRIRLSPVAHRTFELGVLLGVRYYWLEGAVRSRDPNVSGEVSDKMEAPVPSLGLAFHAYPGPLELYAQVHGIALDLRFDGTDYGIAYVEAEAGATFHVGRNISFTAAYRILYLDLEQSERRDDFDRRYEVFQHGPLLLVGLRF